MHTDDSDQGKAAAMEFAPTGRLRAAINFGNAVLAKKDEASGEARGVSVDLAMELATRLGLGLEIITFNGAGRVVEAATSGAWDVAFLAVNPGRAADIDFTQAYVVIEGAYLVRDASPIRDVSEVDKEGIRVATATGSAYDLFLTRELKKATVVRAPGPLAVVDRFVAEGLEVAAGVKQQLEADARRIRGLRLIPGSFMTINQAMALPKGRSLAFAYLRGFIEELKASGFVAKALARHGIEGVGVAPPATA